MIALVQLDLCFLSMRPAPSPISDASEDLFWKLKEAKARDHNTNTLNLMLQSSKTATTNTTKCAHFLPKQVFC